jgi:hypothetical protein
MRAHRLVISIFLDTVSPINEQAHSRKEEVKKNASVRNPSTSRSRLFYEKLLSWQKLS